MSKTIKIGGRIESVERGGVVTGANAILDDTKGKKQNVINSETDSELARLDEAKQNVLTFDNAPTEDSNNPVKSGGVYAADAVLQQAIEAILQLIPSAATALNQLADKAFVNSTVATNTATFRGTYNVVTDLSLHYNSTHQEIATALLSVVQTADNNDYCFVQIPVSDSSDDIRVTERYKFNGTAWSYEYDLNNSGFTADQWAAINSTITLALVQKLGALPTAAELAQQLATKQNTLTFDAAPVAGSDNPVKSGGLYNVIAAINATIPSGASVDNKLVEESRLTQYVSDIVGALDATFNVTSTDGHVNVRLTQVNGIITSVEVLTNDIASEAALNALAGRVTINEGSISLLQAAYNALQQSAPVIVEPTDTWPVVNPSATVIYRVIDRVNTPPQYYSDYMFSANDLTTPVLMATYNNAIDDVPTAGSNNLVKSGGVYPIAKKTEEIDVTDNFDEEEKISLQTDLGVEFGYITPTESDFKGLKSDGKKVLKEETSYNYNNDEEIEYETDSGETVAKINSGGIEAKDFKLLGSNVSILEYINGYVKKQSIKVQIPDIVYAIEGLEFNIYNDTVSMSCDKGLVSPVNYKVVWNCTKGRITERGYRFTPLSTDVGDVTCKCSIYTMEDELLDEKAFTIKVVSKYGISSAKRILFCGDSLGQGTASAIYSNFHSELFGGIIPTMVGSVGADAKGLFYGGWKWRLFASAGETMFRCQVSGITSLSVGARYVDENNGLFSVEEVNITGGTGNVLMRKVYDPDHYDYHDLAASGTLTKVLGSGDDSFAFTSQNEPGNPLWNASESKLDVASYRTSLGLGANEKIDLVIFQLTVNDAAGLINQSAENQLRNDIIALYNAFIDDNPNCIFAIGTEPVGCNTANGFGSNNGVYDIEDFKRKYYKLIDIYLEFDNDKTTYPNLRLLNENNSVDRYYGYPFSQTEISFRYPTEEQTHSNAVHPALSGYAQMGDEVFAGIVNILNV